MKTNLTSKQLMNRCNTFNYFKTSKLTILETLMLFYQAFVSKENKQAFDNIFKHKLLDKQPCYKVTFTNNNKLMIDNKLNDLTFLSIKELVNNYFMLNNDYLKRNINFNKKCFIQVDKQQDITYYNVYLLSKYDIKEFQILVNFTNYKYKFNFNKKERKLVFRLKNNYLKGFKYSYNFYYYLDLLQDIKTIKQDIKNIKQVQNKINKELKDITLDLKTFKEFPQAIENLQQDKLKLCCDYSILYDKEIILNKKLAFKEQVKDNLLFSLKEQETTLNDYDKDYNQFNLYKGCQLQDIKITYKTRVKHNYKHYILNKSINNACKGIKSRYDIKEFHLRFIVNILQ